MTAFQGTYCGPAPDPGAVWTAWNLDPVVILGLVLLAAMLWRRGSGIAAVLVLAVAFLSPLCALSAALFSARVVHHILLVAIAAPLVAASWPARRPRSTALPFLAATATLWLWHLPAAYDAALGNVAVYWFMQATLLGTAIAFWRAVLQPQQPVGPALIAILAAYVQMALLGALLTFAPDQLYAIHASAPLAFGITPLADQQLGGLIMWVPAGLPFLLIGAIVARRGWRAMGEPA
jgi:putative membrane protein